MGRKRRRSGRHVKRAMFVKSYLDECARGDVFSHSNTGGNMDWFFEHPDTDSFAPTKFDPDPGALFGTAGP